MDLLSEVLSRSCFQVSCVGDLGYVDFLFMPNESNIITFQKCHKFVRDTVLGGTFVKVNMTDHHTRSDQRFIQPVSGLSWAGTEYL